MVCAGGRIAWAVTRRKVRPWRLKRTGQNSALFVWCSASKKTCRKIKEKDFLSVRKRRQHPFFSSSSSLNFLLATHRPTHSRAAHLASQIRRKKKGQHLLLYGSHFLSLFFRLLFSLRVLLEKTPTLFSPSLSSSFPFTTPPTPLPPPRNYGALLYRSSTSSDTQSRERGRICCSWRVQSSPFRRQTLLHNEPGGDGDEL